MSAHTVNSGDKRNSMTAALLSFWVHFEIFCALTYRLFVVRIKYLKSANLCTEALTPNNEYGKQNFVTATCPPAETGGQQKKSS